MLEANKVRRDIQEERGAARRLCERPTMSRGGGGVCEYLTNEKRGGSVHLRGTVLDIGGMDGDKRRGEVYMCLW